MSHRNDFQETKVYLALAAWRSCERLRGEADRWESLVEQRIAKLSEAEREEFFKKRSGRGPAAAESGVGSLFQRSLAPR